MSTIINRSGSFYEINKNRLQKIEQDVQTLKDAPSIPDGIEQRIEALESLTNASGVATAWSWYAEEIRLRYPSTVWPSSEGLGNEKTSLINGGNYVSDDGRLKMSNARLAHIDPVKYYNEFEDDSTTDLGAAPALVLTGTYDNVETLKERATRIAVNGKATIKGVLFSNDASGSEFKIFSGGFTQLFLKKISNKDNTNNFLMSFKFKYDGGNMSQGDTLYLVSTRSSRLALKWLRVNY